MADTTGNNNEEQIRDITVGGTVEESVVVNGNSNVIYVGAPAPVDDNGPAFRVLTIVARALDVSELPDIADAWSLAEGLRAVNAPVEIAFLRPPTRERLELVLDNGWDVLHFDGHGTAEDGGFLLFETEEGLRQSVPTDDFIARLKRTANHPKLVILSACQSAKGDGDGLAGRLAREAGVAAVIGFRESVPVDLTMAFVGRLYAALGAGRTIEDAFTSARDSLQNFHDVTLPPENEGDAPRVIQAVAFPALTGSGLDQALCRSGRRGAASVEREPLVGVPAPSESGRFYGIFEDGNPPTGRKGLLARAARTLLNGEKMLVLIGQGGIGKSALAAALARRLAWRYPGGVFWVDGASYQQSGLPLDEALNVFALRFGEDFLKFNTTQKRQLVLAYLEQWDKPSLWIIDNAEVAEEAVWQTARQVGGRSAVLLTSRDKPEYGGSLLDVDGMQADEALPFLVGEVRRRKNDALWGVTLNETQLRSLFEITRLVDGHALALLHAAALIADEGLASAEKLVKANPARGETTKRFDFSYARLAPSEAALLHRLAAFAADFDAQAIEAVCANALDEQDSNLLPGWEEALRGLARKSFVEVHPWNEDYRRYRLHPVMREYARAKAAGSLARDEWRMAQYYLFMADSACKLLGNTQRARSAVAFAERERLNLLAAQEVCLAQEQDAAAISFAYRLDILFERSGRWDVRRQVLENGLRMVEKASGQNHAGLLLRLGVLADNQGDYTNAHHLYQQSLEIAQQTGDEMNIAKSLGQLGILCYRQGDYVEARHLTNKAGELFKSLGEQEMQAIVLHQLGILANDQGEYLEAHRLYQESLKIKQEIGNKAGVAASLHQLGMLAEDQGEYTEARRLYQEGMKIMQQLGNKSDEANTLHQLGTLAHKQGDYAEAYRFYHKGMEILQQLGDKGRVSISLHQLGMLANNQGEYAQARRLYYESLEIKMQLGDKAGLAYGKAQLSLLEQQQGNLQDAIALIQEAEKILSKLGNPIDIERARRQRLRIEEEIQAKKAGGKKKAAKRKK